ncbi:hypothetical protein Mal4_48400 [Maioricimonas rarisocia]|uniref:Four helix bundle protein n=1 Tax=Maioricimonas rarisocia TaxID=2528026 RepID=A0A517ZDB6_9PLAN|nr:four helix bundle protein [Maioricimonas rarisocia]QDU40483.1 hypothetical protein Mal4_48400 [Maioricimonas rarisocia]
MAFAFEKLLVYRKSVDIADAVCRKSEAFSRRLGILREPLNRASFSIAANITEENGRFTKRDRRNFF